ncbi:MAG: HAD-IIA family hydrolase [Nocardioides sp.]
MLASSSDALSRIHDLGMFDLDGVVYIGGKAVAGAAEHLEAVRGDGMRCAFITNNAARQPGRVAQHLRELGVSARESDVVTSAQAAARVLRERIGVGAAVVVLGGEGLHAAVLAEQLVAVDVEEDAEAIVTGYGPDVRWSAVMRAAVRIRDGLWWVASNTDGSIPTAFGVAPGHGVLVETLQRFAGVDPVVAGKPERPLLDETIRRVGGERPLMIGDRLDTDIQGARRVGIDSLLVLTGVTGLDELVAARPEERPTYLGPDLGTLRERHRAPERRDHGWALGGWVAQVASERLQCRGEGAPADWWRCVAAAAWTHLDDEGDVADVSDLEVPTPPRASSGGPGR